MKKLIFYGFLAVLLAFGLIACGGSGSGPHYPGDDFAPPGYDPFYPNRGGTSHGGAGPGPGPGPAVPGIVSATVNPAAAPNTQIFVVITDDGLAGGTPIATLVLADFDLLDPNGTTSTLTAVAYAAGVYTLTITAPTSTDVVTVVADLSPAGPAAASKTVTIFDATPVITAITVTGTPGFFFEGEGGGVVGPAIESAITVTATYVGGTFVVAPANYILNFANDPLVFGDTTVEVEETIGLGETANVTIVVDQLTSISTNYDATGIVFAVGDNISTQGLFTALVGDFAVTGHSATRNKVLDDSQWIISSYGACTQLSLVLGEVGPLTIQETISGGNEDTDVDIDVQ